MREPGHPNQGNPNPKADGLEKNENSRSIEVVFSVNGEKITGRDPSGRISKIIFIQGYRPETAKQWRGGTLPLNGETWKCVVVADTNPSDPHKGAIIVRLEKNAEEFDFQIVPSGRRLYDASEYEVAATLNDAFFQNKVVRASEAIFSPQYNRVFTRVPAVFTDKVAAMNKEWVAAEAKLHEAILHACENKEVGYEGPCEGTDLEGTCTVNTRRDGKYQHRVVEYRDLTQKYITNVREKKPVTTAIECTTRDDSSYLTWEIRDIKQAVKDLGKPDAIDVIDGKAHFIWEKYFPQKNRNTSTSNHVYDSLDDLFSAYKHHSDSGAYIYHHPENSAYRGRSEVRIDVTFEELGVTMTINAVRQFESREFGSTQFLDLGFHQSSHFITGFHVTPAELDISNLPDEYKKSVAQVLQKTLKPLQEHTGECRIKCLESFAPEILKKVEDVTALFDEESTITMGTGSRTDAYHTTDRYGEDGETHFTTVKYIAATVVNPKFADAREVAGRDRDSYHKPESSRAELQGLIDRLDKGIAEGMAQLNKYYSQTSEYTKEADPLIYGNVPKESEKGRELISQAEEEYQRLVAQVDRAKRMIADKTAAVMERYDAAEMKRELARMYEEKNAYKNDPRHRQAVETYFAREQQMNAARAKIDEIKRKTPTDTDRYRRLSGFTWGMRSWLLDHRGPPSREWILQLQTHELEEQIKYMDEYIKKSAPFIEQESRTNFVIMGDPTAPVFGGPLQLIIGPDGSFRHALVSGQAQPIHEDDVALRWEQGGLGVGDQPNPHAFTIVKLPTHLTPAQIDRSHEVENAISQKYKPVDPDNRDEKLMPRIGKGWHLASQYPQEGYVDAAGQTAECERISKHNSRITEQKKVVSRQQYYEQMDVTTAQQKLAAPEVPIQSIVEAREQVDNTLVRVRAIDVLLSQLDRASIEGTAPLIKKLATLGSELRDLKRIFSGENVKPAQIDKATDCVRRGTELSERVSALARQDLNILTHVTDVFVHAPQIARDIELDYASVQQDKFAAAILRKVAEKNRMLTDDEVADALIENS